MSKKNSKDAVCVYQLIHQMCVNVYLGGYELTAWHWYK
jgi:hypothetical protein